MRFSDMTDADHESESVVRGLILRLGRLMDRHSEAALEEQQTIDRELAGFNITVSYRSAWSAPDTPLRPAEYRITLRQAAPAVRIVGTLDNPRFPETLHVEWLNSRHRWVRHRLDSEWEETTMRLLADYFVSEPPIPGEFDASRHHRSDIIK